MKWRRWIIAILLVAFTLTLANEGLVWGGDTFSLADNVYNTVQKYYFFNSKFNDGDLILAAVRGMLGATGSTCMGSVPYEDFLQTGPASVSAALIRARKSIRANCRNIPIDYSTLLYGAIRGMIKALNDPLSEFMDPNEYSSWIAAMRGTEDHAGIGVALWIYNGHLTVICPDADSPAERAGVRAGDQILGIDGESTAGISLGQAFVRLSGKQNTAVTVRVRHMDGGEEDITIIRATITGQPPVKSKLIDNGKIGYIKLNRLSHDAGVALDKALRSFNLDKLIGMILDLRNNPGGLLSSAISVSSRFVDKGIIVTTKDRISGEQTYWSSGNKVPNLPLAVLVNRGTASGAEIIAGAIRDHNMGILIGQQTAGVGSLQQIFNYSDGSILKLTIGEIFTSRGQPIQNAGLEPSILVKGTSTGNPDPYITAAIAWIHSPSWDFPPTAFFTLSSDRELIGKVIRFDASGSFDPKGTIVRYEWEFGDGTIGEGRVVTHAFSTPGTYTVKLTVTDNDGASASIEKVIKVFRYGGQGGPA